MLLRPQQSALIALSYRTIHLPASQYCIHFSIRRQVFSPSYFPKQLLFNAPFLSNLYRRPWGRYILHCPRKCNSSLISCFLHRLAPWLALFEMLIHNLSRCTGMCSSPCCQSYKWAKRKELYRLLQTSRRPHPSLLAIIYSPPTSRLRRRLHRISCPYFCKITRNAFLPNHAISTHAPL